MDASKHPVDVLAELFGDDPRIDRQWLAEMRDFMDEPVDPDAEGDPLKEWREAYEKAINAPDADCPGCGVQNLQMHREGCPEFERIKKEAEHAD